MKHTARCLTCLLVALALAACGTDGESEDQPDAAAAPRGPIDIWHSNNPIEIDWAKQMIDAWNAEHPDEEITGQEIPTGQSSEEVIAAAITAGSTPCLIFNGAQIATPDYEHAGGLVPLEDFPDAVEHIESRSGTEIAEQYKSPDGIYRQIPWKANPMMIFYNKQVFERAGMDPEDPPLSTHDEFLTAARQVVEQGGTEVAIAPSPTGEFYQSIFDFYPFFAAETGGTLMLEDGEAQFDSEEGLRVAELFRTLYEERLAPNEQYAGDAFAEEKAAMASVGPWAISNYEGAVDWGVVPMPTSTGLPPEEIWTYTDAKTISIYASCENRGTAWEVLKFATGEEQDGQLLERSGQMPLRQNLPETYSEYFAENPAYETFADQASRVIEVPYIPHSVEVWQTFRDNWIESVIFGRHDVEPAMQQAADRAEELASGW